ncbi:MAG: ABC transporter ATP-binding protein [Alphaproteobacteria bacterium]|nr:MAG: ABC transporter ATP-binding protein [Alphaproteobacteria bacterium]
MNNAQAEPFVRVENLTKRFRHVVANDAISFDIRHGEIHCLLGENGAGKSTLAECLYGFFRPDSGHIYFKGKRVDLTSPASAIRLGIGMVHQHFILVPTLSVLENIVVGTDSAGLFLNLRAAEARLKKLCENYGVDLDLRAKVWQLPVGQQQWVEILKTLYVDAELLILDEPTAVLTPQESQNLFRILRQMTGEGLSVVLITHKLNEVMQSDRVTVLRKGARVATVTTSDVTKEELTAMMVGREIDFELRKSKSSFGDPVLEIDGLRALNDKGLEALRGVSLTLHKGEILGIAGVAGNGQKELFEALVGVRPVTGGTLCLNGEDITGQAPSAILAHGIGHIPEDRFAEGLIPEFTIAENLVLGNQRTSDYSAWGFLKFGRIADFGRRSIEDFEIVAPSIDTVTNTLSGGNAQKVIVAREFAQSTTCILANQPSRGLDVGVIQYVHRMFLEKRAAGFGILLASEDLEELFTITDRIAVMFKGEILAILDTGDANIEDIGLLMAGQRLAQDDQPAARDRVSP